MRQVLALGTLLLSLLSAPVLTLADEVGRPASPTASASTDAAPLVADFSVFVDPPTGFVFVKLPQGWKFAGKAEGLALARLPSNVLTNLLPPDEALVARLGQR